MSSQAPSDHSYRFSPEIISQAVCLHRPFGLSFRDTENLRAQRGITVIDILHHVVSVSSCNLTRQITKSERRKRPRVSRLGQPASGRLLQYS